MSGCASTFEECSLGEEAKKVVATFFVAGHAL